MLTLNFRNSTISIKLQSTELYKLYKRLDIYKISPSVSIKQCPSVSIKQCTEPTCTFPDEYIRNPKNTSKTFGSLRNT